MSSISVIPGGGGGETTLFDPEGERLRAPAAVKKTASRLTAWGEGAGSEPNKTQARKTRALCPRGLLRREIPHNEKRGRFRGTFDEA